MKKTARMALVAALCRSGADRMWGPGRLEWRRTAPDDETTSAAPTEATLEAAPTSEAAGNPDFKACMVSDSGGFDDKGFNQTALKGQTDAETSSASRPRRSSRPATTSTPTTSTS